MPAIDGTQKEAFGNTNDPLAYSQQRKTWSTYRLEIGELSSQFSVEQNLD